MLLQAYPDGLSVDFIRQQMPANYADAIAILRQRVDNGELSYSNNLFSR